MKGNENTKLSPRQLGFLPHLLSCSSYEEAARRSNISAKQVHQWLKDPSFRRVVQEQQQELFHSSMVALKAGTGKAVNVLLALLENEDPRIRLTASEKVLANALKSIELLEIEERLSKMEEFASKAQSNQRASQ